MGLNKIILKISLNFFFSHFLKQLIKKLKTDIRMYLVSVGQCHTIVFDVNDHSFLLEMLLLFSFYFLDPFLVCSVTFSSTHSLNARVSKGHP